MNTRGLTLSVKRFSLVFCGLEDAPICAKCQIWLMNEPEATTAEIAPLTAKDAPQRCPNCGKSLMPFTVYLWLTNAPEAFDGFGTFTLSQCGTSRIVATLPEHTEWQRMRYGSGCYSSTPSIGYIGEYAKHVTDIYRSESF